MAKQQQQKKKKVPQTFEHSKELQELGEKVIDKESLDIAPARVDYVIVYPNISKTTAGKCTRTRKLLTYYSDVDYVIEMSGELWDNLDEPTRYILMHHELMHINAYMDDNGNQQFKIRPHDIQDFSKIITKHGHDWISKVKVTISSLYDLKPEQEADIQI